LKEERHKLPLVVMVEEISQKMEGNSVCSKTAVYFMISFRQLCIVTVSLPLCALLICFVTAYIFQQDDIHETHCQVSIEYYEIFFFENKFTLYTLHRLGCEADHSPPSSAKVKNAWSYTSTPQYAFMVWCSVKKSTRTTLPLTLYITYVGIT
jgi:hypothetical protein